MKRLIQNISSAAALCSALFIVESLKAQDIGQWDFNGSNLVQTAGADLGDLQYADGVGGTTQLGTRFGTTASFGLPSINGSNAVVMYFPAATNGAGYLLPVPPYGNGGGTTLNEWTLIMDLLYPSDADSILRPVIDTGFFVFGPDFIISPSDGVGSPPNGPYFGSIASNTWYRIGIVVTASEIDYYVNGSPVGTQPGAGVDFRYGIQGATPALILGTLSTNAGDGYVNSIQFRTNALNAGQMSALGVPSGGGIPITIPPVPSFIQSSSPGVNQTGVYLSPSIHIVLNQGDTTVTASSIILYLDGVQVPAVMNPTPPTFDITYTVPTFFDPNSIHNLSLVWQDSVVGLKTNTWSFTVVNYQNVVLPTPFYLETFDGLTENVNGPTSLPTGWQVSNQSWPQTPGFNLDDLTSDSYGDWVLVTAAREASWAGPPVSEPADRTDLPPIVLNGQLLGLSNFLSGNLMWGESDQRCGSCWGQYQELYTADINCTGRTNVFVAFNSFYEQNQDNMNACEYSVDQGATWLPVRYFFCTTGNGETSDIYYTNDASGTPVIDVGKTFSTPDANRNWAPWPAGCTDLTACPPASTNYGIYVKAPISTQMIPFIGSYTNDDTKSSKEIVIVRLAKADGQSHVRFRFLDDGTSSWFWGIDNLGLYEINTPVITIQPQSQTVDAGTRVTFSVTATSLTPLTYQWRFNGINIATATNSSYTITNVVPVNAGQYQVVLNNSDGPAKSSPATLTVVTTPLVVAQPVSEITDPGVPVSIAPVTRGGRPLSYFWYFNGNLLSTSQTTNYTLSNPQPADSGSYFLILTNSYGAVTTAVAQLTVFLGPISSNLVVHLPFDGNFNDSSGRGNNASYAINGTAASPTPTFAAGKIGQSFQYTTLIDGSKYEYASLGYPADLKFGSGTSFAMSFWINYTNQDDDPPFISNKDWNSSGNPGWGVFCQGGGNFRENLTGPTTAGKYSVTLSQVIKDGTWHNLVMSVVRAQPGYVYTYLDGLLIDRSINAIPGTIDTDGIPLTNEQGVSTSQSGFQVNIGQDGTGVYHDQGSAYNIGAHIDDLGIWRRALTAGEAAAIFSAGQAGHDLSQAVVSFKVSITVSGVSGGNLHLTWPGSPTVKLQQTGSLSAPVWTDVAGTLGASSASVPLTGRANFFRLAQ